MSYKKRRTSSPRQNAARPVATSIRHILAVPEGLEGPVRKWLIKSGIRIESERPEAPGELEMQRGDHAAEAAQSPWVEAIYEVLDFEVPRPRGLLGDVHFERLSNAIGRVLRRHPGMSTFRFGAAGSESSVFRRLAERIESSHAVRHDPKDGELFVRVRPSIEPGRWEALVRTTRRPLSLRAWRRSDYDGAMNGPLAACLAKLSEPRDDDIVVDPVCGSGTLLIERLGLSRCRAAIGVDRSPDALAAARKNDPRRSLKLLRGDACALPLPDGFATTVLANLPWDQHQRVRGDLRSFYARAVREAVRVSRPGARFVLLTQAHEPLRHAIAEISALRVDTVHEVEQRGFHPRIFIVQRR